MTMGATLECTDITLKAFTELKQLLAGSSVLALPDYRKSFVQTVDCRAGHMTSLLAQKHGDKLRPVAYYSYKLDPVAAATPNCVQAVIAASMAVEKSSEVVLFHSLTLLFPLAGFSSLT